MKKIIAVIYILLFSLGLSSCDKDDDNATQEVFVGFLNSKMDVSEHSGVLDIPLAVSGVRDDINLDVIVNLSTTDGSAKKDVDYKLPESVIKINSAGNYVVQVTIIDNDEVNEIRNFKVSISSAIGATKTDISEVEVFVLSEDRPPVEPEPEPEPVEPNISGKYTFTATSIAEAGNTAVTSPVGYITIEKDTENDSRYRIRDLMYLINETSAMYLVDQDSGYDDIYIDVDDDFNFKIPTLQKLGAFGMSYGDGLLYNIDGEYLSEEVITIATDNDGNLVLIGSMVAYFDGVGPLYNLADIVFVKVE